MLSAIEQKLLDALQPRASQDGLEIVTVEVVGSRKAPTIRIYLDTPQGITFDEITQAQSWVNEVMDELDPFPGAYTLEVSSPGVDRPLRTPGHFERFAGEQVYITTTKPIDGRSRFNALLKGYENDCVMLELEGETVAIPYDMLKKAHVKGVIEFR